MVDYTGSYPETAFEEVIEANRRGTWTINALIGNLKYWDWTCPVTRLIRSWESASGFVTAPTENSDRHFP
jgi:hypothetical protein